MLLAAGVVALAVVLFTGKGDGTSCALTTAGVSALAAGAHNGASTEAIIATAAVPVACKALVDSVTQDPEKSVSATVQLPSGGTTDFNGTGQQFVTPAPPSPGAGAGPDVARLIACTYYTVQFLYQDCTDGTIPPPSTQP